MYDNIYVFLDRDTVPHQTWSYDFNKTLIYIYQKIKIEIKNTTGKEKIKHLVHQHILTSKQWLDRMSWLVVWMYYLKKKYCDVIDHDVIVK